MRSFALGCLFGCSLLWLQTSLVSQGFCVTLSLGAAVTYLRLKSFTRWLPLLHFSLGLCFAFSWANWTAAKQMSHRLPMLEQRLEVIMEGYVCSLPRTSSRGVSFYFCPTSNSSLEALSTPEHVASLRKVYLSWYFTSETVKPLQPWRFVVRLKPVFAQLNPGSFDTERWALLEEVGAVGYIKQGEAISRIDNISLLEKLRYMVVSSFESFTQDSKYQGWHMALTTGERTGLSHDERQLLRDSGTAHLIAISGLHVGLVFLWCYSILSWLWRRSVTLCKWFPAEKIALIFALIAAAYFSFLAGLDTPTQRALVALALYVVSRFILVRWSPFYLLSLTLVILLLIDPLAVLSEGFWLSLIALLIIFWSLPLLIGSRPVTGWLRLQAALSIGMSVVGAFLFGAFSINALVANIVAIPAVSFVILPLDLIAYLNHALFPGFSALILSITDYVIDGLSTFLSHLNLLITPLPVSRALSIYVCVTLVAIFVMLRLKERLIVFLLISNLFWLGLVFIAIPNKSNPLDVYFLDVGQGLSVVVRFNDDWMVYDTGYSDEEFSSLEAYLLPFLQHMGVKSLKYLVVSHGDIDHSGAWEQLVATMPTEKVIHGEGNEITSANCDNETFRHKSVTLTFFQGQYSQSEGGNNASCLLKISYAETSVLLTGDIERHAEMDLIRNFEGDLRSDVMLVPHHGSKTSSSWSFLMQVEPKLAIVTNGYLNRFGHPHPDIRERYRIAEIELLETSKSGMIRLSLDGQGHWTVTHYRDHAARFWNHAPLRRNLAESVVN